MPRKNPRPRAKKQLKEKRAKIERSPNQKVSFIAHHSRSEAGWAALAALVLADQSEGESDDQS